MAEPQSNLVALPLTVLRSLQQEAGSVEMDLRLRAISAEATAKDLQAKVTELEAKVKELTPTPPEPPKAP